MSHTPPRVVLDCMVFLQGAGRRHGASRRCLELADAGQIELWLSPEILAETAEVLDRPLLRARFPLISSSTSQSLLRALFDKSRLLSPVPKAFRLPRDPDDEIYLNLAIAADARYLVTWNERHLTYLMKADTPEGVEFCRRYPNLTILDPPALLAALPAVP